MLEGRGRLSVECFEGFRPMGSYNAWNALVLAASLDAKKCFQKEMRAKKTEYGVAFFPMDDVIIE